MSKKHLALVPVVGLAVALAGWSAPVRAQQSAEGPIKVEGEGRTVMVEDKKFSVSGSRTKVMIGGKEAKREDLKNGMTCTITASGEEASAITCK